MSAHDVFQLIGHTAKGGYTDITVTWSRITPKTIQLLEASGYNVRRGGIDNEVAIVSWASK